MGWHSKSDMCQIGSFQRYFSFRRSKTSRFANRLSAISIVQHLVNQCREKVKKKNKTIKIFPSDACNLSTYVVWTVVRRKIQRNRTSILLKKKKNFWLFNFKVARFLSSFYLACWSKCLKKTKKKRHVLRFRPRASYLCVQKLAC